jgi:hypothetical protein
MIKRALLLLLVLPGCSAEAVGVAEEPLSIGRHPVDIATTQAGAYAVLANGTVYTWGSATYANDGRTDHPTPRPVAAVPIMRKVAATTSGACGIASTGKVTCWGPVYLDERDDASPPFHLTAPVDVVEIAASGFMFAARTRGGQIYVWGHDGGAVRPALKMSSSSYVELAMSRERVCARRSTGEVHCMQLRGARPRETLFTGSINVLSRKHDGDVCSVPVSGPIQCLTALVDLAPLTGGGEVALGRSFGCEVTPGGYARCTGSNEDGELGDGTYVSRLSTTTWVRGLTGVTRIDAAVSHACAIAFDPGVGDSVFCWGNNDRGQLGIGSSDPSIPAPVRVRL